MTTWYPFVVYLVVPACIRLLCYIPGWWLFRWTERSIWMALYIIHSEPIWTNHWLVTFIYISEMSSVLFFVLQRQFFGGHQSMAVSIGSSLHLSQVRLMDEWHGIITEKHVPQSESFRKWSVRQLCYQLAILQLFSSAINPMSFFPVLLAKVITFRLAFDQVQLRVSCPGQSRYLAGAGGDGAWINTPELGGCKMAMFIWKTIPSGNFT